MTIDVANPGVHSVALAGAGANLSRRANVDWFDDSNSDFSGTIDTTAAPYSGASAEGQSAICAVPNGVSDSGIWVLGSHADPAAVPVTLRSDATAGSVFTDGERILLNTVDKRYVTARTFDGGFAPVQQGEIGTAYIDWQLHVNSGLDADASGAGATASGDYATASGRASTASGADAVASGRSSTASGSFAVASGFGATASGRSSIASGESSLASGIHSVARGKSSIAYIRGMSAHSAARFAVDGDAQREDFIGSLQTTNDTPAELVAGWGDSGEQYVLPNSSSLVFTGSVVAREGATGDSAGWKFEGVITRDADATETALIAAVTPTLIAASAGAAAWDIAVTADATNGALVITATGEAAKAICWVARIDGVKVIYAP